MALFKSTILSDIRGSVNGTVFSRNKSGAIMRNRTNPVNTNTTSQQAVRLLFGTLSAVWRGLTTFERASFTTQAPNYPYLNAVGESSVYSGQQLFNKLNGNLQAAEEPIINFALPPQSFTLNTPGVISANIALNTLNVSFTNLDASLKAIVYLTPAVSAGLTNVTNLFKKIDAIDVLTTNTDIGPEYAAVYGIAPSGFTTLDTIYIRIDFILIATGQRQFFLQEQLTILP